MIKYLKKKSNSSYGVGQIYNLESYLKNKYKDEVIFIRENILDLPKYTMNRLDDSKKHCALTAITRIMHYYSLNGYDNIPNDEREIYKTVRKKSFRVLGYLPILGTFPFRISSIFRSSFREYNYSVKARGKYAWNFYTDIVKEIDNNRPLVFNIMRGYYRKHTITVVGYSVYSVAGDIKQILIIQDGWSENLQFLDFNNFTNNLAFAGIGSFNSIEIKKLNSIQGNKLN